jgi:hypothetical protein
MSNCRSGRSLSGVTGAAVLLCCIAAPRLAAAPPTAVEHPYTLSVFAQSTGTDTSKGQYSQPDSIVQWKNHIIVGFQNHVLKDGTDGKSSTIVQYSLSGKVERTFSVPGHNDGLRVVGEDDLWSLQNEDANPNLVVINLESGQQKNYTFAPPPHGGGYDDMRVLDGKVLMTASNPMKDPNIDPALVIATLHGKMVEVEPVLFGNASATDIATGAPVKLNLQDPDSLTIDPRGNVLLDDQADSQLIFIRNVFSDDRVVGVLKLPSPAPATPTTVDDTTFASSSRGYLLFSDVSGDTVYRVDSDPFGFEPGTAYSASDTLGFVGVLNLDNGAITPIVTGLGSARGMIFVVLGVDDHGDK